VEIGGLKDPREIKGVVPNMPIKDSRFLKDFLEKNTPGVKTEVDHECESCHHEFKQKFSTDHNFLKITKQLSSRNDGANIQYFLPFPGRGFLVRGSKNADS